MEPQGRAPTSEKSAGKHATHDVKCLRCLRPRQRCLQPTFCRACDDCGEEEDVCNPCFPAPAVPATTTGMPATRVGMPATHIFAVPAVPVATTRMLATHVFPCLHRLRVAVGASGAEAALFISSRFKKRKMIPASWPDLRRLWAPLKPKPLSF